MILLKQLLQELDMSTMQPYATQFVWEDRWRDGSSWMAVVPAAGTTIQFKILSEGYSGTAWNFGFWMPVVHANGATYNRDYTTSAARSTTNTTLSYLRILSTCLEAIRDFTDTHNVERMDISGADSDYQKGQQKTRIYAELFKANATMFPDFKVTQPDPQKLVLQRIQRADATGVPANMKTGYHDQA